MLNYKRMGQGRPLIILHGLFGMLDNWQSLANRFAETNEVILVDQRNHGHSFHSPIHNYDVMSDDLEEFISELDLDDPILLGHSMGGKTVMKFAQTYSDVSSAIIVADISPRSYKVHHDRIVEGLQAVPVGSLQKRTDAKSYMMPHIQDEGVVAFLMKSLYWREKGDLQFRFNLDVLADSLEDVGEAVMEKPYSGQALFIYGGASNYVRPERDFQDIDLLFPNNQKTSLEGTGHWLHAEQPDAFYNAVSGFIANLD